MREVLGFVKREKVERKSRRKYLRFLCVKNLFIYSLSSSPSFFCMSAEGQAQLVIVTPPPASVMSTSHIFLGKGKTFRDTDRPCGVCICSSSSPASSASNLNHDLPHIQTSMQILHRVRHTAESLKHLWIHHRPDLPLTRQLH